MVAGDGTRAETGILARAGNKTQQLPCTVQLVSDEVRPHPPNSSPHPCHAQLPTPRRRQGETVGGVRSLAARFSSSTPHFLTPPTSRSSPLTRLVDRAPTRMLPR